MMVAEDDEGFISFDAAQDDEMAELFSFGAEGATAPTDTAQVDYKEMMQSVMPIPVSDDDESNYSDDSLLELMEQQKELTVVDPSGVDQNKEQSEGEAQVVDLQEILDWLEADDELGNAEEDEISFVAPPESEPLEKITAEPETPLPPPVFDTLEQAVKSPKSTIAQIRILLEKERFSVAASVRPHLWCKVVCGKTLEEILQSSVADSFQQWEQAWNKDQEPKSEEQKKQLDWIQKESSCLADRIVMTLNGDVQLSQRALASILVNHYSVAQKRTYDDDDDEEETDQEDDQIDAHDFNDPLLPPVACAILSTGVPKVGAAIMLSNIVPNFMPILGLTSKERLQAAHVLHSQFYLLVCYHLPLLALHLDRYLPDWYEGSPTGLVPQSWLISHLAGECGGAFMNPRWLQCLWDLILTSNNNSLRFFLTVAVLQSHAEQLLLLIGDALTSEVKRVMSFNDNTSDDGFAIEAEEQTTNQQAVEWVHEWTDRAQALWEATPILVVRKLKHLEDEAVNDALLKRQEEAEERLRLKLEAQARAHQEAMEKERERNAQEARLRLTRARLVAFYLQYNPGKESNIDKIMKTFEGRYEVLDSKLKQKYGVGFNPALKPKSPAKKGGAGEGVGGFGGGQFFGGKRNESEEEKQPRELVLKVDPSEAVPSICWSKEANRSKLIKIKEASKLDSGRDGLLPLKFYVVDSRPEEAALAQGRFPTSVSLSPEMLLDPDRLNQQEGILESLRGMVHICIMGEGYSALPQLYGHRMTRGLSEFIKEDDARNRNCALFFLKRGFPFVSIVDGGFAAMHSFLCREGPNIHLDAQNVLTDYNPDVSLFGQFEKVHNSTGREKAQRKIHYLFDSSMAALTMNTMRFEKSVASEAHNEQHQQQKIGQNVVTRFFGRGEQSSKEGSNTARSETSRPSLKEFGKSSDLLEDTVSQEDLLVAAKEKDSSKPVAFRNPFARKRLEEQESNSSLEVESVDFDKPQHPRMPQEEKDSKATPKVTRQPPNSFSIFKQGQDAPATKEEAKKSVPTKETSENSKSRFAFSMFGKSNDKKTSTAKGSMVDHFAGFKSKMEKMKTEVFQENKTSNTEKPAGGQPTLVSVPPKAVFASGKINTMPSQAKPTKEDEAVEDPRSKGKKPPGSDQGSTMTASPSTPNAQSTREQMNVGTSGETPEDGTIRKETATKTEESESLDQSSKGPPASAFYHPDQKSSEEVNE
jgi:hypothetical protein